MATVRELLAQQPVERIREILAASPRRFREEMFNRLGIKSKASASKGFRFAPKGEVRARRLQEALGSELDVPEDVLSELVRNFFYTRRSLLADALDFFEVEHREGLTDRELDFLENLPTERVSAVEHHLGEKGHDAGDVELYLRFMGFKH